MFLLLACSSAFAKPRVEKRRFTFEGKSRIFYSYVPEEQGGLPVIVLLHGSGRDGAQMADAWKSLAASEHVILVAPNAYKPAAWDSQDDSPAFLHAVVDQVKANHQIDAKRIYLFGHSGGAVYALALALIDSEYYAATAVHAGALPEQSDHLFSYPKRHMPVAIWVGDRDAFFPLDRVRATQARFEAHGFQLQLTVVPNHTHTYDEASEMVDRQAWKFFKDKELPVQTTRVRDEYGIRDGDAGPSPRSG